MLLGRDDVDPDDPDECGQTPLWWAAYYGYEGIVKILLKRGDVTPDKPDSQGRTPPQCTAENGHAGVMALL